MQRALELAKATLGLTSPNPQVGCVLAHANVVVGEGAHRYDLRDHAEVVALKQAGERARAGYRVRHAGTLLAPRPHRPLRERAAGSRCHRAWLPRRSIRIRWSQAVAWRSWKRVASSRNMACCRPKRVR